ncbi:hypothetical protein FRB97_001982 [Tulasnella sp. 331]|nr:hypothetical protein FRB97_001982 [Tulasnella sp. 331]
MYLLMDVEPLPAQASRIVLAVRPAADADIDDSTFRVEKIPLASLSPKRPTQVLVQVKYISIDAGMRLELIENLPWNHAIPLKIGETMRAETVGVVVQLHRDYKGKFDIGDEVICNAGWVTYGLLEESEIKRIETTDAVNAIDYLGSLGGTGLTAYFGLTDIGKIKSGETCFVSGAAGAVGSTACQLAKIQGAKVVGIAGGPVKCKYLVDELGVDVALDYKSSSFAAEFKKAGHIDVFFDNVGGYMLDMALANLNKRARLVICGGVSQYGKEPTGITGTLNLVPKAARMEGFSVWDYRNQYQEAQRNISRWIEDGKIKCRFYIAEPFERCPQHLANLLKGINVGKMVVRV